MQRQKCIILPNAAANKIERASAAKKIEETDAAPPILVVYQN